MNKEDVIFDGENPNEEILFVLRRTPWTLMRLGLVLVALAWIITLTVRYLGGSIWSSMTIFALVPLGLYLAFRGWFLWSQTVYVLTNERIITVEQTGWFQRLVKEVQLKSIITISHRIAGVQATLLNAGDVHINASGADVEDLVLTMVTEPYEVQQRIVRAKRAVGTDS